jgi:2',3'-cyclic-nucleotide 2'-phosphodiesterase (5'-nucleotidase family)
MTSLRLRTRRVAVILAASAVALTGVAATGTPSDAAGPRKGHHAHKHQQKHKHPKPKPPKNHLVDVQLLSFNDFHGNLEGPSGSSGRNTEGYKLDSKGNVVEVGHVGADGKEQSDGGAAYLATHLAQARQGHPNSLTVAAGDLIGASPLLSAAFHDEPTIESMNALELDASAVGNHEFDEGYVELQRMANGGCLPDGAGAGNQDSCPGGKSFTGADFPLLAANVRYAGTNRTILPAYTIKEVGGAKIGFIGMTLEQTPDIVTASGVAGLEFDDEVATANKLVPVLKKQGVRAIVVLIHQGANLAKTTWTDPNGAARSVNPTWDATCAKGGKLADDSPILPIAENLDPEIDMVVSGHTHQPYVCNVPDRTGKPRMVTSASSFGRLYTDTELQYDTRTRDIVRTSVTSANFRVSRDVPADPAQTSLIAQYNQLVLPIASRVLGKITTDVTNTANPAGESTLGDLIADAQLADDSVVTGGETPVVAFMNPGGIRTSLTYASTKYADRGEQPGDVTYEEAFAVQPFNNYLVSLTMTGAQIQALLDQQVTGANSATSPKILQVSDGFSYSYDNSGAINSTVQLDGKPLVDAQTYRVVTNNFLADGGDGFPAFKDGTNRYFGGLDIDAFADYLSAQPGGYTPPVPSRITKVG